MVVRQNGSSNEKTITLSVVQFWIKMCIKFASESQAKTLFITWVAWVGPSLHIPMQQIIGIVRILPMNKKKQLKSHVQIYA